MNLRNKLKKFFTLNRTANGGFTLVELIVVIAILAILGGVGTAAYSGYIKKANMAADQTLVSDVAKALQMHYYDCIADGTEMGAGYVVLTPEGEVCLYDADGVGLAAMDAAFGDGWEQHLALSYDGWDNSDLMGVLTAYSQEELDSIANSSYLTTSTPASLMKAVTGMTNLANVVISGRVDDLDEARKNLVLLFDEDSDIVKKLDSFKMEDAEKDEYSTVISNMLVNQMATSVEQTPNLQNMLNLYAAAYAYGEANNDFSAFDAMTTRLQSNELDMSVLMGTEDDDMVGYMFLAETMLDENGDVDAKYKAFETYLGGDEGEGAFSKDTEALKTMMGAVKEISGGFMDKDSLLNANLFTTDGVMAQVDSYYNSVKALAAMDKTSRAVLKDASEGAVIILIAKDGAVAVIPGEVSAAN